MIWAKTSKLTRTGQCGLYHPYAAHGWVSDRRQAKQGYEICPSIIVVAPCSMLDPLNVECTRLPLLLRL